MVLAKDAKSAKGEDEMGVPEDEIGRQIVDAAYKVHVTLGPGLLESVYEAALGIELSRRGLKVEHQLPIPVHYYGVELGVGFKADLLVNRLVLVELKSVETIHPVHKKQTLTYLKLGGWKLGYLINFNTPRIKEGITRVANGLIE